MRHQITLLLLLTSLGALAQQFFPGGVAGAEAWYIVNHQQLSQSVFPNLGMPHITIDRCTSSLSQALFNFNHSAQTNQLCLYYSAPLENTTSRNVFFVSEPNVVNNPLSHLTTDWNSILTNMPPAGIRNNFDLAHKNSEVNGQSVTYQSVSNANINFYHWNIYQIDRKFKSYGYKGETTFSIGKQFTGNTNGSYFQGNFPEFISFPFELTANQKNRVESYLALKYGITLDETQSYRNSKNIEFWKSVNNGKFKNRIFGIGRDDISGLNQLQSESVHLKDYLITSIGPLLATNPLKQQQVNIRTGNFIVYGDTGKPDGLDPVNSFGVRALQRKWLSQSTGPDTKSYSMFFKLNLEGAIKQALLSNPNLKVWMLHDKFVTNQQVSDFNSQYVEYYEPASMTGVQYSFFENVHFDPDDAIYDQYTFGVGPKMIVQARFQTDDCADNQIKVDVVITGGKAPYSININNNNGYNQNFSTSNNVLTFNAVAPNVYVITVQDSGGLVAQTTLNVVLYPIQVNLGNDITLNASQQQATLNAGQYVTDSNATYEWYFNGELIDHHYPTLVVTQPGEYEVIVTSGNRSCKDSDKIKVRYNFTGNVQYNKICEADEAKITVNTSGGVPPFTTEVSGPETISQVHNSNSVVFTGLEFGQYTVTTTDSFGNVFQQSILLNDLLEGIELDLLSQIQQPCYVIYSPSYSFPIVNCDFGNTLILDASVLVTNPNATYAWYEGGIFTGITSPVIEISNTGSSTVTGVEEFKVIITNPATGCSISESFGMKPYWDAGEALQVVEETEELYETYSYEEANSSLSEDDGEPANNGITSKIYPNPSDSNTTFYYEVSSNEIFTGTVQIFTPTGALLTQVEISGESTYTLSFELITAGTYVICTTTNGTTLTDKVIIK